mmetsp:Transcript_2321/g.6511  ORF Transcript_2321/g.6511 Transcript_2321/m.6511 type:complete len:319 (-) Transcript_2321:3173-4129(-)
MILPSPITNFSSLCSPEPIIALAPISHSWALSISSLVSPFCAAFDSVEETSVGPPPSFAAPRVVVVRPFFAGAFLAGAFFFAGALAGTAFGAATGFRALASWSFLARSSASFFVLSNSFSRSASSRFFVNAKVSISCSRASTFGSRGLMTGAAFSFFAVFRGWVLALRVVADFLTCLCVVLDRGLLFSFAEAFLREARSFRGPWHDSNSSKRACNAGTSKPELMVQTPGSFSRNPRLVMRSSPPGTTFRVDSNFAFVAWMRRFLSSFGSCNTFLTYVTANSRAPDHAPGSPDKESTALLTAAMSGMGRSRVLLRPSSS